MQALADLSDAGVSVSLNAIDRLDYFDTTLITESKIPLVRLPIASTATFV